MFLIRAVPRRSVCNPIFTYKYSASVRFSSNGANNKRLHVAIVGSGPSAFYCARTIVRRAESARVDIIEKLPVPFGLVRYGVAPDHPEVKNVTNEFEQVLDNPNCQFLGNIAVGRDISLSELRGMYHAVVLAYGADDERHLNIEGEQLEGCLSARAFVNWYNGHPDFSNIRIDLSNRDSAVIIGNGNVALDVARVILRPISELEKTDIADYALDSLSKSRIKHVHVIGRRGPSQAAWTTAELRDLTSVAGVSVVAHAEEIALDPVDEEFVSKVRAKKRGMTLLNEILSRSEQEGREGSRKERQLHLRFLLAPKQILPRTGPGGQECVGAISLERNRLRGEAEHREAVGTGEHEELACDMMLRSVGYRSVRMEGLPWDARRSVVPSVGGRVQGEGARGVYVTGWLRRGPTGIIGSNIADGQGVAQAVVEDQAGLLQEHPPREGRDALRAHARSRGLAVVDTAGWRRIAAAERALGNPARPLRKITSVAEMLAAAGAK